MAELLAGEAPVRKKGPDPVVGFCGLAGRRTSWTDRTKPVLYHTQNLVRQRWADVSPYKGEILRAAVIDLLTQAPGVQTNFLVREQGVFFVDAPASSLVDVRRDYLQNALDSDYLLVCRGIGELLHPPLRGDVPRKDPGLHRHRLRPAVGGSDRLAGVVRLPRRVRTAADRRQAPELPRLGQR